MQENQKNCCLSGVLQSEINEIIFYEMQKFKMVK